MTRNFWPQKGSVLRVAFSFGPIDYDHYGVYVGSENVVHFSEGTVRLQTLRAFIASASSSARSVQIMGFSEEVTREITPEQCVQRASSKLGYDQYNLGLRNCEHFATWCRTGIAESSQVLGSRTSAFDTGAVELRLGHTRNHSNEFGSLGMHSSYEIYFSDIISSTLSDHLVPSTAWISSNGGETLRYHMPRINGGIHQASFLAGPFVGDKVREGRLICALLDMEDVSPIEVHAPVDAVIEHLTEKNDVISGDLLVELRVS